MSEHNETDAFLFETGGLFRKVGDTVAGRITERKLVVDNKFGTGEPDLYKDGTVKHKVVVKLTANGKRTKLHLRAGSALKAAVMKAVTDAGSGHGLEPGGTLAVSYVGDEPIAGLGSPRKLFAARYISPRG